MLDEQSFKATFRIINAPIPSKLWLKWKGRKMPGWRCTRSFTSRYDAATKTRVPDGHVTFKCKDRKHFADMTPEKIEEIIAMISILKGMPDE